MDALKLIAQDSLKSEVPAIEVGDTVKVSVKIREGDKERIQDTAIVLRSVMEQLWKREERYEVCLYNAAACEFSYFLITEESQIMETLIHFFYMPL